MAGDLNLREVCITTKVRNTFGIGYVCSFQGFQFKFNGPMNFLSDFMQIIMFIWQEGIKPGAFPR